MQSYSKLNFASSKVERQGALGGDPVEVVAIAGLGRSLKLERLEVSHLTLSAQGLFQSLLITNSVALRMLDGAGAYYYAVMLFLNGKQSRSK